MIAEAKIKKRAIIMSGGGARAIYEAGVIHAFHISGMEFDVITGSSFGAFNCAFFSEYLYYKRKLPDAVSKDPLQVVEVLDARVRAFHHAWLQMPAKKILDISASGPLGAILNDLEGHFDISLSQCITLVRWWTDPEHGSVPPSKVWPAILKLSTELLNMVGGSSAELLRILKYERSAPFEGILHTYLARFGLGQALVPPDQDHRLKDIFTQLVSPLREAHLSGDASAPDPPDTEQFILVSPARTLKEYDQLGIVMRVTRANYRTGRLEISAYVSPQNFVRFLDKHAWRLGLNSVQKVPPGSLRLPVLGNPNVINAALCAARFPGVFAPYPIRNIYPSEDTENISLFQLLTDWLFNPVLAEDLKKAYQAAFPMADGAHWNALLEKWRDSDMREFFPRIGDIYIDAGSIDNSPSNSAMDYLREWSDQNGLSRREMEVELFAIILDKEPRIEPAEMSDPSTDQVVNRALMIQGASTMTSLDVGNITVVSNLGGRGQALGLALKALLESVRLVYPDMSPEQKQLLEKSLSDQARQMGLRGFIGAKPDGILERMTAWSENMLSRSIPLDVSVVKIFPEIVALDTFQITEPLGYKKENAILMLSRGCFETLWTLRAHLGGLGRLDAQELKVLEMLSKWMGISVWPQEVNEQEKLRHTWACQRVSCVYHAHYCQHGAAIQ